MARSQHAVLQVDANDWRLYTLAQEALSGTGTAIDTTCREFAEAKKILGSQSLITAAQDFIRRADTPLTEKAIPELVEAFIQAKKNAGVGSRRIEDYRSRPPALCYQFPLTDILGNQG